MFSTLRWAIHAIIHGTMLCNRQYMEEEPVYIPGIDKPIRVKPGQRIEIILYPVGK
jgi:hypothetical protein